MLIKKLTPLLKSTISYPLLFTTFNNTKTNIVLISTL